MSVRGVRGAITADDNTQASIAEATAMLIKAMCEENGIASEDIASCFFTTSPDLTAGFPASAARALGWTSVPLLCGHEMAVPEGLTMCIRVMIHWNTDKSQADIQHVYLKDAKSLRPEFTRPDHE